MAGMLPQSPPGFFDRLAANWKQIDSPLEVARKLGLNVPTGRQAAAATMMVPEIIGPQADVKGMVYDAGQVWPQLQQGNYGNALGHLGLAAAAIPMMALPGTVESFKKGVKKIAPPRDYFDAVADQKLTTTSVTPEFKDDIINDLYGRLDNHLDDGDTVIAKKIQNAIDHLEKPPASANDTLMIGPENREVWESWENVKDINARNATPPNTPQGFMGEAPPTMYKEITQDSTDWYKKYYSQRTFDNVDDAKKYMKDKIVRENAAPGSFGQPVNPDIVDSLEFVKSGKKFRVKQTPKKRKAAEIFDEPTVGMESPKVNWNAQDMQDYGGTRRGYINVDDLPKDKLAGGKTAYDWDQFNFDMGGFPPATIKINKNGTVSIVDGNHRIHFWRAQGMDEIPVKIKE